jgi:quercetin dioxygenase-like cupin family protein
LLNRSINRAGGSSVAQKGAATMKKGTQRAEIPDPIAVDPQHYQVEFENEYLRVLRINYGPHEKSVMHGHPAGLTVFLTDARTRFTFPDGTSEERPGQAGQTLWMEAETHLPENLSDQALEVLLIEVKTT